MRAYKTVLVVCVCPCLTSCGDGGFTNSIGMKMVCIKPGTFLMGSPEGKGKPEDDEEEGPRDRLYIKPGTVLKEPPPQGEGTEEERPHRVTITRGFYMSAHEITQEHYEKVMGTNPSHMKKGGKFPVEEVCWEDAVAFCKKLSALDGKTYRLPTEAEWEYACRAGSTTRFCFGDANDGLTEYGWYGTNSGEQTHPVEQKRPNAWDLYDMHGNVREWCQDWYARDYLDIYARSPGKDPMGPASGVRRVLRGGGYWHGPHDCRAAARFANRPRVRNWDTGFRVVCSSDKGRETEGEGASRDGGAAGLSSGVGSQRPLTNSIGMNLVAIKPGTFIMGSPPHERGRKEEEIPHWVKITRGFYMGSHEVTQGQYKEVMGVNLSVGGKSLDCPVDWVSWNDAVAFCKKLSEKEGKTYRLPTEAEWEYACRAGSVTRFCSRDSDDGLGDYAWFWENSDGQTRPVGQKRANAWGLYDMHGNVSEWCQDWYVKDHYRKSPETDPIGPARGSSRVLRGGCWQDQHPEYCRSAYRDSGAPDRCQPYIGFRVVRELSSAK